MSFLFISIFSSQISAFSYFSFFFIRVSILRSFSKLRARCGHRIRGRQMRHQGLHVLRMWLRHVLRVSGRSQASPHGMVPEDAGSLKQPALQLFQYMSPVSYRYMMLKMLINTGSSEANNYPFATFLPMGKFP